MSSTWNADGNAAIAISRRQQRTQAVGRLPATEPRHLDKSVIEGDFHACVGASRSRNAQQGQKDKGSEASPGDPLSSPESLLKGVMLVDLQSIAANRRLFQKLTSFWSFWLYRM
jgi:hypothetical protein